MSNFRYPLGTYVRVIGIPDPWEGSGEDDCDRESLVGHVGVVVDQDDIDGLGYQYLVRFASSRGDMEYRTCQRWIEEDKLKLAGLCPKNPITQFMFEQ